MRSAPTEPILALINAGAGSIPADADQQLSSRLNRLGRDAEVRNVDAGQLASALADAKSSDYGTLVVWGGDGTAAMTLNAISEGEGPDVLLLPGGTMNLLHNAIHGAECRWEDCLVNAFSHPAYKEIVAGSVSDRTFYVGAIFGVMSRLSHPREAIRDGNFLEAWEGVTDADVLDLDPVLSMEVETPDGSTISLQTSACAVFVESIGDRPVLEVGALKAKTALGLAAVLAETATVGWRDAQQVAFHQAHRVTISHLEEKPIPLTLDGEPAELDGPLSVAVKSSGQRVLTAA